MQIYDAEGFYGKTVFHSTLMWCDKHGTQKEFMLFRVVADRRGFVIAFKL